MNAVTGGADFPIRPFFRRSAEGIRGARRAGMKCLAATNSHPAELLGEATAVVESLEEVSLPVLQALLS